MKITCWFVERIATNARFSSHRKKLTYTYICYLLLSSDSPSLWQAISPKKDWKMLSPSSTTFIGVHRSTSNSSLPFSFNPSPRLKHLKEQHKGQRTQPAHAAAPLLRPCNVAGDSMSAAPWGGSKLDIWGSLKWMLKQPSDVICRWCYEILGVDSCPVSLAQYTLELFWNPKAWLLQKCGQYSYSPEN